MNGVELLGQLDERGLSVSIKGDKLIITPADLVTKDVVADVSAHSGELAALLEKPPAPAMARLMRRLRQGQEWLTAVNDELVAEACGFTAYSKDGSA